jgi:hypothetical protein
VTLPGPFPGVGTQLPIALTQQSEFLPAALAPPTGQPGNGGPPTGPLSTETTWINAAAYLPTLVVITSASGHVLRSETIAMLPPRPANLGELVPAPVPAGFRVTALPGY